LTTPINALPYPSDASPNDPPIHFTALATALDTKLVPAFASDAARNSAITSPTDGQVAYSVNRFNLRRNSIWTKIGGAREILVASGSFGNSGLAPANATTGIFNTTFSSPVAADTGHIHFSCAIISGSSAVSTGTCNIIVNSVTLMQQYFIAYQAMPTPVPIDLPLSVISGTNTFAMSLTLDAGVSACQLSYSALRITI
jgi:hypothetical protein